MDEQLWPRVLGGPITGLRARLHVQRPITVPGCFREVRGCVAWEMRAPLEAPLGVLERP